MFIFLNNKIHIYTYGCKLNGLYKSYNIKKIITFFVALFKVKGLPTLIYYLMRILYYFSSFSLGTQYFPRKVTFEHIFFVLFCNSTFFLLIFIIFLHWFVTNLRYITKIFDYWTRFTFDVLFPQFKFFYSSRYLYTVTILRKF